VRVAATSRATFGPSNNDLTDIKPAGLADEEHSRSGLVQPATGSIRSALTPISQAITMAIHRWSARVILLTLGLVALRSSLAADEGVASLPVSQFAAAGIRTVPVRSAPANRLTHLPAHVQIPNAQQRIVAAPVGGLVTAVMVGVGEPVKEGQVMARLVSPQLLELQRELAQAAAERERTQQALARDERLLAEGLIAASRVEGSRAADRHAAATMTEKRGLLALTGARPGRAGELALIAPMNGIVLAQSTRAGERVEPATTLFHVARLDLLDLDIELPLAAAARVAIGAAVRVPESGALGTVIAIGRAVSDGQTLKVRARMTAGLAGLNPGQHVEAEIETRSAGAAAPLWLVPGSAVVRLGKGGAQAAVFAQRGEKYLAVAAQVVGESGSDLVIEASLKEAESVVSDGASQLKAALAGLGK